MESIRNRMISEWGAPKIVYDFIRNRKRLWAGVKSTRNRTISEGVGHLKSYMISCEIVRNRIRLWVSAKSSRNRTISHRFHNDFITISGGWGASPTSRTCRNRDNMKSLWNHVVPITTCARRHPGRPKSLWNRHEIDTKSYDFWGRGRGGAP